MVAFYKHNIPDWMDGTESLSHPAYRAYHVICQLIYLNEGPIALNERGIAGRCNLSTKGFRGALEELLQAGKLTLANGQISNSRAEIELENVRNNRKNAGEGGKKSGTARNGPRNQLKTQDTAQAPLPDDRSLKEKTREESESSPRVRAGGDGGERARTRIGSAELIDRLVEAASGNVVHGAAEIEIAKPMLDLLAMGCDLDKDILPAVAETVPKLDTPLRTWGARWLRDRILERQAARLRSRGTPAAESDEDEKARWERQLAAFFGRNIWAGGWGATPEERGCRIPTDFIAAWKAEHLGTAPGGAAAA